MTRSERMLARALANGVDSYESNNADEALPMSSRSGARLLPMSGNPAFDAQFDIQFLTLYFSVAAGVYTQRTAAYMLANAPSLATQLTFFLFGQMDFEGGYKKIRSQYPVNVWNYGNPFAIGNGNPTTTAGDLDATALAQLQLGDVVQPFVGVDGGVTYVALVVTRCVNVAYSTLLAATSSDSFVLNRIRYIQNDTSAAGLLQFNNAVGWYKQSLFGKFDQDSITPNSQKPPEQFQAGIIDIPILKTITKEIAFGSYVNYDAVSIQWSIFVRTVNKLPANL